MSGGLTLFAVWVPCFFLAPRARQVAVLLLAPMFFALSRMLSNRERGECLAAFAFGALLPLLPMLGSGTLLVSALIYLWLHPRRLTPKSMEFILPVLMVLGVWTLLQLWFEFDASLWKAVWMGEGGSGQRGVEGVLRFIRFSPPAYLVTFQCLVRFLLIFMLFEHFRQAPGLRRVFWQGLMWGLIPAAALSMFQILSGNLSLFPNLGEYWQALGRFSGTFSDPNAFGIFVVLALPLMTLWSFAPKVTRFWML
ncbi:MAG: hypothetical protein GX589_10145, partial [Deltaproteobacteria bacterium]|nr:hypothetical protein [Deltaproteobacteria bacterium]